MLKQTIKTCLISGLLFSVPIIASANTNQTEATTSSNYVTLNGSTSDYVYPDHQKITMYPSIKVAIPLTTSDYTLESVSRTPMYKNDTDHSFVLALTATGESKVNEYLANLPQYYEVVNSSKSVIGQFNLSQTNSKSKIKIFKTGEFPTKNNEQPSVQDVMMTVTLTNSAKSIKSANEFKKLKDSANTDQKDIQKKLGTLSKSQLEFIQPGNSSLSVEASKVNTNTDVKTAQSQSKTKIVNLDSLKQAKNADKIDKQKEAASKHAKTMKHIFVASITSLIAVIIIAGVLVYKKVYKKEAK